MKNYLRHQKFPDGISTKGDKQILEESAISSALQMDNWCTKVTDFWLQTSGVESI